MKMILNFMNLFCFFYIPVVFPLIFSSCSYDGNWENPVAPKGQVLKVGQKIVLSNRSYSGSIEAPGDLKRVILLNGNRYNVDVKARVVPVGEDENFKPGYGVLNPGESFYPHRGVQIVYLESIQDFKDYSFGKTDLEGGLTSSRNSGDFCLSNDGLYLRISGSHESGRLSFVLEKMEASRRAIRVPSLPSLGRLELR